MNRRLPLLTEHPIFQCLNRTEMVLLLENIITGRTEPRKYIYKDDNRLNQIFFVESGSVLVGKNLGKANEMIFQLSMNPTLLGLPSLILGAGNHQFAKAVSPLRYISCNKTIFKRLVLTNPKFHYAIQKQLGHDYFELEEKHKKLHCNLKLHNRLKLFLEEIHIKNLNQTLPKKRIDLHITHLEIAKLLQGSRQSVSLNLAKMRDEKIIDYDRNWMKIIDLKALRKWEL